MKITNSNGDYKLWANVKTTISNFELNVSTNYKIEDKPTGEQKPLTEIYLGSLIILILILIIITILWFKKKKSRSVKKSK